MTTNTGTAQDTRQANKVAAMRFIEALNTDDWHTVREMVVPDLVFHHPICGTVPADRRRFPGRGAPAPRSIAEPPKARNDVHRLAGTVRARSAR